MNAEQVSPEGNPKRGIIIKLLGIKENAGRPLGELNFILEDAIDRILTNSVRGTTRD